MARQDHPKKQSGPRRTKKQTISAENVPARRVIIEEDTIAIPNDLGVAPYDTLLILQAEGNDRTDGGIILPDSAIEKPSIGTVIVVGDRTDGKTPQQVPGDIVQWGDEAGREVKVKGADYLLIKQRDILWTYKN